MSTNIMRAKLKVESVIVHQTADEVTMRAVCKDDAYDETGKDENNTFAKFSPTADFKIMVANPDLFGKLRPGDTFYVDFTPAVTGA